jgi:hypothetical protein
LKDRCFWLLKSDSEGKLLEKLRVKGMATPLNTLLHVVSSIPVQFELFKSIISKATILQKTDSEHHLTFFRKEVAL